MAGYIGKSQSVSLSSVSTDTVETQDIQDGAVTNSKYGGAIDVNASAPADSVNIDASGNLLVGTTDTHPAGNNVEGTVITSDGWQSISANSTAGIIVNRKTSDGNIIQLRKDSTTVGSIGSATGGTTYIDGGSTYAGITFGGNGSTEGRIVPRQNGAIADNKTDLGTSSYRFKNLYLSGGVYVGGTGSANYLDDYEEGTWTPTVSGSSTGTATLNSSYNTLRYEKIGNVVHIHGRIRMTAFSGTGNYMYMTLPFNVASGSGDEFRVVGTCIVQLSALNVGDFMIHPSAWSNKIEISRSDVNSAGNNTALQFSGDELIGISVTYRSV